MDRPAPRSSWLHAKRVREDDPVIRQGIDAAAKRLAKSKSRVDGLIDELVAHEIELLGDRVEAHDDE